MPVNVYVDATCKMFMCSSQFVDRAQEARLYNFTSKYFILA